MLAFYLMLKLVSSEISQIQNSVTMASILASLSLIGLIAIAPLHTAVIKSTHLNTSHTDQDGARIEIQNLYNPDCTILDDQWIINVSAQSDNDAQLYPQRGYHLEMNLDNTWGFHPNQVSSIRLTILSPTNISSNNSTHDPDLSVTFSVNNNQFIVPMLKLDGLSSNKIYPDCDTSSNPTQPIPRGDVKDCVDRIRCNAANRNSNGTCNRPRSCKSTIGLNFNNYTNMQPSNLMAIPQRLNNFPLTLTLTNDPIKNQSFITLSAQDWNGFQQGCGYGQSFDTDAGLQIYLDDTDSPTISPSSDPTIEPTFYPPSEPSSEFPSLSPTDSPTIALPDDIVIIYSVDIQIILTSLISVNATTEIIHLISRTMTN